MIKLSHQMNEKRSFECSLKLVNKNGEQKNQQIIKKFVDIFQKLC